MKFCGTHQKYDISGLSLNIRRIDSLQPPRKAYSLSRGEKKDDQGRASRETTEESWKINVDVMSSGNSSHSEFKEHLGLVSSQREL